MCQSVLWNISCLSILHGYSAGVINRTKTFWTQLDNVTKEQNGNYTCLVKNQSGENGSRTIELEMKGETFTPKFCIDRIGIDDLERNPQLQDKVISVVDCVGKI